MQLQNGQPPASPKTEEESGASLLKTQMDHVRRRFEEERLKLWALGIAIPDDVPQFSSILEPRSFEDDV